MFTGVLTGSNDGSRYHLFMNGPLRQGFAGHAGGIAGYCGRPSSSFSHAIFSVTQMCSVGAKALRSSKVASATPAAVPFRRQANSRVPQALQNTRSSVSDEA